MHPDVSSEIQNTRLPSPKARSALNQQWQAGILGQLSACYNVFDRLTWKWPSCVGSRCPLVETVDAACMHVSRKPFIVHAVWWEWWKSLPNIYLSLSHTMHIKYCTLITLLLILLWITPKAGVTEVFSESCNGYKVTDQTSNMNYLLGDRGNPSTLPLRVESVCFREIKMCVGADDEGRHGHVTPPKNSQLWALCTEICLATSSQVLSLNLNVKQNVYNKTLFPQISRNS